MALADVALLRIDATNDKRMDLRAVIGQMRASQPYFAFFDPKGRLVPGEAITGWNGRRSLRTFLRALDAARAK